MAVTSKFILRWMISPRSRKYSEDNACIEILDNISLISHGMFRFRVVVVLLVTVYHSQLVKAAFHGRVVVGVTIRENVYLVQHIEQTSDNVNLGFITTVFLLDEIHLAQIISK